MFNGVSSIFEHSVLVDIRVRVTVTLTDLTSARQCQMGLSLLTVRDGPRTVHINHVAYIGLTWNTSAQLAIHNSTMGLLSWFKKVRDCHSLIDADET